MSLILETLLAHSINKKDSIALQSGKYTVTYGALSTLVINFSKYLVSKDVKTLGFQLDNSFAWAVVDLAATHAGINIVPIPVFFTEKQCEHIIETAKIDFLICGFPLHLGEEWQAHSLFDDSWNDNTQLVPSIFDSRIKFFRRPIKEPIDYSGVKITFTSGSSGQPKGVCLSHEAIETVAASIVNALRQFEIETHLCVLPLATLLENIAGFYAPLIKGIVIHMPSLDVVGLSGASLDVEKFSSIINEVDPNSIILVPQLLTAIVTLKQFQLISADKFKMMAVGGGRVSEHLIGSAEELGLPVCQGYGLSECCSVLTLNLASADKPNSVGKALPHVKLRLSAEGEIEASGSNMLGYLGQSEKMNEWYATGDLGYIDDDGFVYITGRKKNVFITSFGRNVNPEWVESALTQQAAISQAIVYGEGRDHNLALIWLRFPQNETEIQSLLTKANSELPDYAQAGAYVVIEEALAGVYLTANGRIKREPVLAHFQNYIDEHYALATKHPNSIEYDRVSAARYTK